MQSIRSGSTGTYVRVAVAVTAVAIAMLDGHGLTVLPLALLVLTFDLGAGLLLAGPGRDSWLRRREVLALVLLGAGCAGAAILIVPDSGAGALSLMLVPISRAGESLGRRAVGAATAVSAAVALGGGAWRESLDALFVVSLLQWLGIAAMAGLLGAWTATVRKVEEPPSQNLVHEAAREAAVLLRRLDTLADALDGGFDAPASAELLLDAVDARVRSTRRGVLVGFGTDPAVPLALRGSDRVPWDAQMGRDAVLGRAWTTAAPESGLCRVDGEDRSMMAVPLRDPTGARIGAVVLERGAAMPFTAADLRDVAEVCYSHSANLDVALIFAALRERAGLEERERLAREMHDGIAQELVALGYRLDVLRKQAASGDTSITLPLDRLRRDLSDVLADLRLRISDLRIAVRPDQGLGAVIGDRLQRFGSACGKGVVLRLNESGFRLPAHVETLIYRLVLDVLADARHSDGTTSVDVTLDVAAPQAFLRIVHDGHTGLHQQDFIDHPLTALGAEMVVERGRTAGVTLQLFLRGSRSGLPGTITPERLPQRP